MNIRKRQIHHTFKKFTPHEKIMKMNFIGGFFMKRSEVRLLWQSRIEAFQSSGETSVAAWCTKQGISVQSMYQWLRK